MQRMMMVVVVGILAVTLGMSGPASAEPKKAILGPCVRECMKTFNPGLAASSASEFLVTDFEQEQCLSGCKDSYTYGSCYFWADGCCNLEYEGIDPDCAALPKGSPCNLDEQCAEGLICASGDGAYGSCEDGSVLPYAFWNETNWDHMAWQ